MNALSTITVFPISKKEINNFVEIALSEVDQGIYNPLDIDIRLKAMEETIKLLRKGIKEEVLQEAEKYNKQDYRGVKINLSERGTYDYSKCNDSIYNEAKVKEQQAKATIKGREIYLKSLKEATPDMETGEVLMPPVVRYTDVLSVKLPD